MLSFIQNYISKNGHFNPTFCFIIYIISFILILISCLFKFYKISDNVYDIIVICVLLIHCFIEGYNCTVDTLHSSFESSESFIGMPDTSSYIEVMLIGSNNSKYMKSGSWDELKNQMSKNTKFHFTFYDTDILDHEYISILTNMDIQRLQHTPSILFQTSGGLFVYDDNIYDITKIQQHLLELQSHVNLEKSN